jgi:hypothetical protein
MSPMRRIFKNFYKKIEIKRPLFRLPDCCSHLNDEVKKQNSALIYSAPCRSYTFLMRRSNFQGLPVDYCIYCGTKIPEPLDDFWRNILKRQYKLSCDDLEDDTKIPPEFLTDEWWKKRNIPNKLSYHSKRERKDRKRRKTRNGCCCSDKQELNKYVNSGFIYNTRFREYGIKTVRQRGPYLVMNYCLWCGRQLEPSLRNLWAKLLQKEHGIANPFETPIAQLPKSFRTDQWWKRRGL